MRSFASITVVASAVVRYSICSPTVRIASTQVLPAVDRLLSFYSSQHVTYGVKEQMYPSVVSALLITLEKGLGKECRPETKVAWEWVMNSISAVCIAAAREEPEGGTSPVPAGMKPRSAFYAFTTDSRVAASVVAAVVAAAVGFVALNKLE